METCWPWTFRRDPRCPPRRPRVCLRRWAERRAVLRARDYLVVYDSAAEVAALDPHFATLAAVEDCWAAIATAPGDNGTDFVSRFFAPAQGVPEDPATGSSHCTLTPYWAE